MDGSYLLDCHDYCPKNAQILSLLLLPNGLPSPPDILFITVRSEITYPHPTPLFGRLLKSFSNWTILSKMVPQMISGCSPMFSDVFQCSQLFSYIFSWVVTLMDNHPLCDAYNHPLCAHFVELSLCSGESFAGPGCFCWKLNWTKLDHFNREYWGPLGNH